MGCVSPTSGENTVDKELADDERVDQRKVKMLLLGTANSGKSTLMKQLNMIYGDGYNERDRKAYKNSIYSQIIKQIQLILYAMYELQENEPDKFGHLQLRDAGNKAAEFFDNLQETVETIDKNIAKNIEILWKESAIREVFDIRAQLEHEIYDSSCYFFNQITRIGTQRYMPTDEDILLMRHPIAGITQQRLSNHFYIYNVCGKKGQMNKWIHFFEIVTGVIFTTSLSSYHEFIFDIDGDGNDTRRNALIESIDLFEKICNSPWFVSSGMILFLNKRDLFEMKLLQYPLTVCFEEYNGNDRYDDSVQFIQNQFENRNKNPQSKQIYTHVTSAVNRSNVEKQFNEAIHIVKNIFIANGRGRLSIFWFGRFCFLFVFVLVFVSVMGCVQFFSLPQFFDGCEICQYNLSGLPNIILRYIKALVGLLMFVVCKICSTRVGELDCYRNPIGQKTS